MKKNKIIKIFFCAIIFAFIFCGCSEIDEGTPEAVSETEAVPQPYPVTIGAMVFDKAPETVGSLSPALTEIICELGYGDRLIGVSEYCDYPESVSDKAKLGSAANPDVDAVIAAAPELLVSLSPIAKKDIVALEGAGIRVWIIAPPTSAPELYGCYESLAAVFGGKLDCDKAAGDALKPLISELAAAEGTMKSFVYIISPELAAASDSTFSGNFFSCFGKNAAEEAARDGDISMTAEELLALDPEWVILPDGLGIYELPEETSELTAIKEKRVITLDSGMLERIERPTSRLGETVKEILDEINRINSENNEENNENE